MHLPVLLDIPDVPDLTIGGWTPTQGQWTAAIAVAAGILGTLLLIALGRRARKALVIGVISITAAVVWIRFIR
ncbi:MAG: hypothetical protein NTX29_01520 [Actinobacteria bacterium]|nr:hypothetical protein [Actinomycetota bacterium]